jgi:hypothetical protein
VNPGRGNNGCRILISALVLAVCSLSFVALPVSIASNSFLNGKIRVTSGSRACCCATGGSGAHQCACCQKGACQCSVSGNDEEGPPSMLLLTASALPSACRVAPALSLAAAIFMSSNLFTDPDLVIPTPPPKPQVAS